MTTEQTMIRVLQNQESFITSIPKDYAPEIVERPEGVLPVHTAISAVVIVGLLWWLA